ncbi:MAG: hypothetical protein JWQ09_5863 [Segetibacter sp.]|nr:hypothetical protein [Segetibacter sp.]
MNITVNANITVFLQAMSLIFDNYNIYVQWQMMVKDDMGTWIIDPANPNCIVGEMINTQTGMINFLNLAYADKITAITTFLQTKYPV